MSRGRQLPSYDSYHLVLSVKSRGLSEVNLSVEGTSHSNGGSKRHCRIGTNDHT